MSYSEIIRESIEYLHGVSESELSQIAHGESRLEVYSSCGTKIYVERDTYWSAPQLCLTEEQRGKSSFIRTLFETQEYRSHLLELFQELYLFSEVSESIGYTQELLNHSFRHSTDDTFYLTLISRRYIRLKYQSVENKFLYRSREGIIRNIVEFENRFLTLESLSKMPQCLRDMVVGVHV